MAVTIKLPPTNKRVNYSCLLDFTWLITNVILKKCWQVLSNYIIIFSQILVNELQMLQNLAS